MALSSNYFHVCQFLFRLYMKLCLRETTESNFLIKRLSSSIADE